MIEFEKTFPVDKRPDTVLALGVFDGVHCGHREIISAAVEIARGNGSVVTAVTFFPHPREIICGKSPELLIPPAKRRELLLSAGADEVAVINFSPEIAEMEPEDFIRNLLDSKNFNLTGLCVGEHWRFGRKGKGDSKLLGKMLADANVIFSPTPEKKYHSAIISATAIRHAIFSGDLTTAKNMLGRDPALFGKVVSGCGEAGKLLAAPTANLEVSCGVIPPNGVYAGSVEYNNIIYKAAVNIGTSPTFGDRGRRVEIHLIGFSGNLYGTELEVKLTRLIRPEKKFTDPAALKAQIAADIRSVLDF